MMQDDRNRPLVEDDRMSVTETLLAMFAVAMLTSTATALPRSAPPRLSAPAEPETV